MSSSGLSDKVVFPMEEEEGFEFLQIRDSWRHTNTFDEKQNWWGKKKRKKGPIVGYNIYFFFHFPQFFEHVCVCVISPLKNTEGGEKRERKNGPSGLVGCALASTHSWAKFHVLWGGVSSRFALSSRNILSGELSTPPRI